jgi:hypothetical protein
MLFFSSQKDMLDYFDLGDRIPLLLVGTPGPRGHERIIASLLPSFSMPYSGSMTKTITVAHGDWNFFLRQLPDEFCPKLSVTPTHARQNPGDWDRRPVI